MKKNISAIILMIALAVCGCDSYLDRQPDDQLTSKNIFDKKTTTLQYLVNVYTYIPSEWSPEGYGSIRHRDHCQRRGFLRLHRLTFLRFAEP